MSSTFHNSSRSYRYFLAAFLLLLLCSMNARGEIYKCTDAQGRVHYTDSPCAGESTIFTPKSAPKADQNADERSEKRQRLLDALQEEREQGKRAVAQQKSEQEKRIRNCSRARDRLRMVTEASHLYRLDEAGNRVVFSDAERDENTRQARADVERWCD